MTISIMRYYGKGYLKLKITSHSRDDGEQGYMAGIDLEGTIAGAAFLIEADEVEIAVHLHLA